MTDDEFNFQWHENEQREKLRREIEKETAYEAIKELHEAWRDLWSEIDKTLGFSRLIGKLSSLLRRLQ